MIFAVITFSVTFVVFGCQDELQESKGELGPEVSGEQVLRVIEEASGNKNILNAGENEAVHIETNQKIEMGGAEIVLDEVLEVFHRAESDENIKIVLYLTTITYPDGESSPNIVKTELDPIYISKNTPSNETSPFNNTEFKTAMYSPAQVQQVLKSNGHGIIRKNANAEDTVDRITIHSLKTKKVMVAPPSNVANAPNCLGIPNCLLSATEIKFDIVEWRGADWNKINLDMIISDQTPYFARELQNCQGLLVDVPSLNRDVYVRQCRLVRASRFPSP